MRIRRRGTPPREELERRSASLLGVGGESQAAEVLQLVPAESHLVLGLPDGRVPDLERQDYQLGTVFYLVMVWEVCLWYFWLVFVLKQVNISIHTLYIHILYIYAYRSTRTYTHTPTYVQINANLFSFFMLTRQ